MKKRTFVAIATTVFQDALYAEKFFTTRRTALIEDRAKMLPITINKTACSVLTSLTTRDCNREAQQAASARNAYIHFIQNFRRAPYSSMGLSVFRAPSQNTDHNRLRFNASLPSSGPPSDPSDKSDGYHPNRCTPLKDIRGVRRDSCRDKRGSRRYRDDDIPSILSGYSRCHRAY